MKVAFCIREDYLDKKGGDTIQLLKTKESLEKIYNIKTVVITNPKTIKEENPDICHIFNLQTKEITEQFMYESKN
ncbi:hypothetical protein LEQ06_18000 [Paraclostridium sp. AKS46]|nr:hypothetical protein [Paraclostridium sp. AKS46]